VSTANRGGPERDDAGEAQHEAVGFLEQLRPSGPWALTAIDPVSGMIETITVSTADAFVRKIRW
jgi:hypothetical protein